MTQSQCNDRLRAANATQWKWESLCFWLWLRLQVEIWMQRWETNNIPLFWYCQVFQVSNYDSHNWLNMWNGLKISNWVFECFIKAEVKNMPLFGNAATKHMDRMAEIPRYVNLNDKQDRDSFNDACYVWNQYIPYCSFCTAPLWVPIPQFVMK